MIGILDCTRQDLPLLKTEFVDPIISIVQNAGFQTIDLPLTTKKIPNSLQGIILTGTALRDDAYLSVGLPEWLLHWTGPVLGICAGMQLITISFGGGLIPCKMIGMTEIAIVSEDPIFSQKKQFNAWEMHNSGINPSDMMTILARSPSGVQAIRLSGRPWYGVLFHPEVRNEWIITNFLTLCRKTG